MKLLIIGSDYSWSIERHYYRYLLDLNPETFLFAAQNRLLDHLNQSIFHKITHKLGLTNIYQLINQELLNKVEALEPDVIWVFKGMQVLPSTLGIFKDKGIFLVNYNPDNPFIFTGAGSGNQYVTQSLPYYDMFFTYNFEIKTRLEIEFKKPVYFLPFAYDLSESNIDELEKIEEVIKPCFLGNPDKDRAKFISVLNNNGIKFEVFGNNWQRFISSKYNHIHPPVYGAEFYKTLRKYRVQLNIMRLHNLSSHNMRTFEIPSVGGIQLAPDTPEHQMFFEADKEIFLYKNASECSIKIKELLNLSTTDANLIRSHALSKSKYAGYGYKERAAQTLNVLKNYI